MHAAYNMFSFILSHPNIIISEQKSVCALAASQKLKMLLNILIRLHSNVIVLSILVNVFLYKMAEISFEISARVLVPFNL